MSQFNTIKELNIYLSKNLTNMKLSEYFKEIHNKFYSNIDISFINYFLELCEHENEFIVDNNKLLEYGVLSNIDSSKEIKKVLNRLLLVEGEDYLLGHVAQVRIKASGESTGNIITNEYKLNPMHLNYVLSDLKILNSMPIIIFLNFYKN